MIATAAFVTLSLAILVVFSLQYWDLLPQSQLAMFLLAIYVTISLILFVKVRKAKPPAILPI